MLLVDCALDQPPGQLRPGPWAHIRCPNIGPLLLFPQDLRGQWSGGIQAYGGGSGPTSLEFDVKGATWQWGPHYGLDSLLAQGRYHSEEGLQLQEASGNICVWACTLSMA